MDKSLSNHLAVSEAKVFEYENPWSHRMRYKGSTMNHSSETEEDDGDSKI
jgi:hypothetical protein